jgi:hypothetical protein
MLFPMLLLEIILVNHSTVILNIRLPVPNVARRCGEAKAVVEGK